MNYQLYQGDCLELMPKHIENESIDLILADLPYGTTECDWDSIIPLDALWAEYKRIIKPTGAIVLTAMQPFASQLVASNLQMFRYEWIWEKGAATGFFNAEFQPMRAHENILVFYKRKPTFNPQKTTGHKLATSRRRDVNSECYGKAINKTDYSSTERYPRSIQFFSSDKQKGLNFHPTQKPIDLMVYLILTYSNEGDTVLDNCMGSGTTGIAAARTGRKFIGIEQEAKYFDIAQERIAAECDSNLFAEVTV